MIKPNSPENEAERLKALDDYHILDSLPEQAYDDIAAIAAQICGTPIALISLIDEKRQWLKARSGIPNVITELPRDYSCCAHAILKPEEVMEVEDAAQDERFVDNPISVNEPYIKFYAGAPMVNEEGLALGTICVIDHAPNKLSEAQKNSLQALSRQVMALLELRKETLAFNQNKGRIEQIAENINDFIYELDEKGLFTYVNPALVAASGYEETELLQMGYYDLVDPEYMDDLGQFYYEQIKAGNDSSYFEFPLRCKSGAVIWIGQTVKIFYEGTRVFKVGAVAKDITELKKVRQELVESESLYRLLSENSSNLVCLQKPDGRFIYVSPSIKEVTGFERRHLINGDPAQFIHPDDRERLDEDFRKALRGEDVLTEFRYKSASGQYIWVESRGRAIYDDQGAVIHVQTSTTDISKRKHDEEIIKREEAKFKALIENSTDIIWSIDSDFRYIAFNQFFLKIMKEQLDVDISIGTVIEFDQFPEKSAKVWEKLYERAFNGERFIEELPSLIDRDVFYECSFNPIMDGSRVIGVSVFARDVSERVQLQMKRLRFQEALALLNYLSANTDLDYGSLIEKAIREVCQFYEMDLGLLSKVEGNDYKVAYAFNADDSTQVERDQEFRLNETYCQITYERQEIIAIDHAAQSEYKDHSCYQLMKLESYLGAPIVVGKKRFGTISISAKSPREVPFDKYDREFFELFGRWVAAILDRNEYEKLIVQEKEKAQNASDAKEQFLSTMSHEIRTPLNAIIGMTHILLQDNPRPTQVENLNVLKFSGENLLVLVNDVLDINKIESGNLVLEHSDFNLKELLESTLQAMSYGLEDKGLSGKLEYDSQLPETLTGDSMRISQVINNLLSNAIKFTHSGTVNLVAKCEQIGKETVIVRFEVDDTGIGMTEAELQKVFERFTQAKTSTSRQYGGSGLGLTIVKGLLELMGSEIKVSSKKGQGSVFSFTLKLAIAEHQQSGAPQYYKSDPEQLSFSNVKVLLVEDNKVNQLVAKKFLMKWGIQVVISENGAEAIAEVNAQDFDLILMDLQMPVMDGYEATEKLREMQVKTPILALTASVRIGQKNRARQVGMDDFLVKPLTPSDLYTKISKFIDRAHIIQETEHEPGPGKLKPSEFQALRELLQGDDEFKEEVVPLYIRNLQTIREVLPPLIEKKDAAAADKLRHKMLTTLSTLEANEIKRLIDRGIGFIQKPASEKGYEVYKSELNKSCQGMEEKLLAFMKE